MVYSRWEEQHTLCVYRIELDGSTGKNFGLLIIDELNRRGFNTGTGNSRENKVDRARRVSADIQKNGIYLVGKDRTGFTKKWAMEFLEKITVYPNEAIHDDCVVAFTGAYEKIVSDVQTKRVDVDRWYSTWCWLFIQFPIIDLFENSSDVKWYLMISDNFS